jgi:hypothetical protein
MALEGRVAAIVNVRELAINIGRDDGVQEGMIFAILAESPIQVRDPMTKRVLGNIDREKVRVKATEVLPGFSVCRTYERVWRGRSSLKAALGTAAEIFEGGYQDKTLRVEDSELPQPLPEDQSYVKVGDRVRQVELAEKAAGT